MMKDILEVISLKPLEEGDLEMLRNWRNDSQVNQFLENRNYITQEGQSHWYQNLSTEKAQYYIIVYKNIRIGCGSLNNINPLVKFAEPGIFIGDKVFLKHPVAVIAVFLLLEKAFIELGMLNLQSKVAVANKDAIALYKWFGFGFQRFDNNFLYSTCNLGSYMAKRKTTLDLIKKLSIL